MVGRKKRLCTMFGLKWLLRKVKMELEEKLDNGKSLILMTC